MKIDIRKIKYALIPHPLTAKGTLWAVGLMFYFQFLYFDLVWALDSTFSGFQFPIGYLTKLAEAALLTLPLLWCRSRWYVGVMSVIINLWLEANLMYFRTYFTPIPAASYGLIGNLGDFQGAVWESLRRADLGLPVITALGLTAIWRTNLKQTLAAARKRLTYILLSLVAAPIAITLIWIAIKGGYKKAYEDLMYDYPTCGPTVYTLPGSMIYEWLRGSIEMTPELKARVDSYLAGRPGNGFVPPRLEVRDNCIILLLESFESFVLETEVEGQEITPNINALLRESNTFYAPKMQTQVGGARSIDAQLILHTGLLPVAYGAYSVRFIHNVYPSIDKAWKEKYGPDALAASFTVDKKTVWNVAVVAQDFGYELYDKPTWTLDVKTGPRGRLGDDSFLRQSYEKIADNSFWNPAGHNLVQMVTYSGHTPFVIPDELKELKFSNKMPERLRNYLNVARYTDRAVGEFISRLRSNPKFANTMIVITGDHEGMGAPRADYRKDPAVARWMPEEWFTPFIVVNSPRGGRYDGVLGQIDMYPTLLDLLGLEYSWRGLGQSLLDPTKLPFAITPQRKIVGDASRATPGQIEHARQAYQVSDSIISSNYFAY